MLICEFDGGMQVVKIIDKHFQPLWAFGPTNVKVIDKTEPYMRLMGCVTASVLFEFTQKEVRVRRSHPRSHSSVMLLR